MKRWTSGAALVVLLLVAGIVVTSAVQRLATTEPTSTVGQYLSNSPRQRLHVGQIVRVRGVLQPLPAVRSVTPLKGALFDTVAAASHGVGLAVYYGPPDPLVSRLRAVPLIARLIPLPSTADRPLLGRLATYRLRVIRCRNIDLSCAWQFELVDGGTP